MTRLQICVHSALSEVELQMLDIHEHSSLFPEKFNYFDPKSKLDDVFNGLAPPSFRELELFCRTSLDLLHLEHAYSAINGENKRARKERKISFEVLQKRKTSVERATKNNEIIAVSESEKSRQERKRSYNKQRSKSTTTKPAHSQNTFEQLLAECETRTIRSSSILRTNGKRERRGYIRTIGENHKNLQKSKSIPEPKRRFSTGTQYKRYAPPMTSSGGDAVGISQDLNVNQRTFPSALNGSFKKNDITVILDECEMNEHDSSKKEEGETEESPLHRRYSTGMRPRRRGYADFPVSENY